MVSHKKKKDFYLSRGDNAVGMVMYNGKTSLTPEEMFDLFEDYEMVDFKNNYIGAGSWKGVQVLIPTFRTI